MVIRDSNGALWYAPGVSYDAGAWSGTWAGNAARLTGGNASTLFSSGTVPPPRLASGSALAGYTVKADGAGGTYWAPSAAGGNHQDEMWNADGGLLWFAMGPITFPGETLPERGASFGADDLIIRRTRSPATAQTELHHLRFGDRNYETGQARLVSGDHRERPDRGRDSGELEHFSLGETQSKNPEVLALGDKKGRLSRGITRR